MNYIDIALKLSLSLILGATIGLEREINEKKLSAHHNRPSAVIGLRSFSLITLFGAVTGFIYLKFVPLALLIATAFFAILIIYYFLDSHATKDYGLTTEITALYSFIIGLLLATELFPIQITIAVTTIVILILSQKDKVKNIVDGIKKVELNAFITYLILALVIMPFLPNESYSISDFKELTDFLKNIGVPLKNIAEIDLFNPFKIWLILVLITGVDIISYVLGRIIGEKRGWLITSMLGGWVSSTATTQAIAQQSKRTQNNNYLVSAAILSNSVSFFQIAIIIGIVNGMFLRQLFPIIIGMILTSMILFLFFLKKTAKKIGNQQTTTNTAKIIDLSSALKFTSLYLIISIFSKIALLMFGEIGLLTTTGLGAIIGLDAVMINTSQLAGMKINYNLATSAFILANAVNLITKSIYSFIVGSKEFSIKFSISILLIIIASIIGTFFN